MRFLVISNGGLNQRIKSAIRIWTKVSNRNQLELCWNQRWSFDGPIKE